LSSKATLPLPEELIECINAYLDKHSAHDDSDSQKLQEELLNIYQSAVSETPSRLAPFLAILQLLKPNYRGAGRLFQWWEQLAGPILVHIGVEKGLAVEARDILLGILVYDEDEAIVEAEAKATSNKVAENLLETWLAKAKVATEDLDEHAKFVEGQIRETLIAFGRKRPQVRISYYEKQPLLTESRTS
jgi:solute carrier family 25 protein 16